MVVVKVYKRAEGEGGHEAERHEVGTAVSHRSVTETRVGTQSPTTRPAAEPQGPAHDT